MIFAFMMKSFNECLEIHKSSNNRTIRRFALATMMAKAETRAELEIVRDIAPNNSAIKDIAQVKLELL
ncbi:MAG: hypothetical protein Q8Q90_03445 [bacterium]|nr:hypothetical protein [bacterium]